MQIVPLFLGLLIIHQLTIVLHCLRCKCNTDRGPVRCFGDFCDIHNRDGKRAACGAIRRAQQTVFSCVLIKESSNDTYCHVVGSATACWCRAVDFCNADLEAELFDIEFDEAIESLEDSDVSPERFGIEAVAHNIPAVPRPPSTTSSVKVSKTRLMTTTTRHAMKTRINPAIRIDNVKSINVKPLHRIIPETMFNGEIIESYDDDLSDDEAGFQWQAITIPVNIDSSLSTTTESSSNSMNMTSSFQKLEIIEPKTSKSIDKNAGTQRSKIPTSDLTKQNPVKLHDASFKQDYESSDGQIPQKVDYKLEVMQKMFKSTSPRSPYVMSSSTDKSVVPQALLPVITVTSLRHETIVPKLHQSATNTTTAAEVLQPPRNRSLSPSPTFIYTHIAPKTALDNWNKRINEKPNKDDISCAFLTPSSSLLSIITFFFYTIFHFAY